MVSSGKEGGGKGRDLSTGIFDGKSFFFFFFWEGRLQILVEKDD